MKRTWIVAVAVAAVAALGAVPAAFADASCPGVGNDCTQTINQGGAGGSAAAAASATGGSVVGSGNSANSNVNVNDLSNRNYNQDVNVLHQGQGQRQGQVQGQQQGQGQGQHQSNKNKVTNTVTVEGDKTEIPAQAPAIFSPNLTSSPEACMGSISGGGGAGFNGISFGFNLGSTWTNQECQDRMNARTLSALGQNQAALEYMAAQNPNVAAALKRAGVKVAMNEEKDKVATVVPAGSAVPAAVKVEKKDAPAEPAPKVEESTNFGKRSSLDIPSAMRATLAASVAGVQGQ